MQERKGKPNSSLQKKYQYSRTARTTRRSAAEWSFTPKKSRQTAVEMITDRNKVKAMYKDYTEFQKKHGLQLEPKVINFKPVDPLKGKSKPEQKQLLISKWRAMYEKDRRGTVKKLLEGTSIFDLLTLPKNSAEFWQGIYREPQGVKTDPSEHLANLEFTPNDDNEWMNEPIDIIDVRKQIRLVANGTWHRQTV